MKVAECHAEEKKNQYLAIRKGGYGCVLEDILPTPQLYRAGGPESFCVAGYIERVKEGERGKCNKKVVRSSAARVCVSLTPIGLRSGRILESTEPARREKVLGGREMFRDGRTVGWMWASRGYAGVKSSLSQTCLLAKTTPETEVGGCW